MRTFAIGLTLLFGLSLSASASVVDYQQAISAHPNLLHHWDFDGVALNDKQGSAHLSEITYGTTSLNVDFVPGFDGTSLAANTKRIGGDRPAPNAENGSGAGLRSVATTLPASLTVQVLFQPTAQTLSGGEFNVGYILNNRNGAGGNQRGYFLMQGDSSSGNSDRLSTIIGNGFSGSNTGTLENPFVAGDWYFYSATFDHNAGPNNTTVNAWLANLSDANPTLDQVLTNQVLPGSFATASWPVSLGILSIADESAFPGLIDEAAIFSGALSQSEMQLHFNTLIGVPEPGTYALGLLGAAGVAVLVWRRRRN